MGQFTAAVGGSDLDFLNINQTITCIAAGPIASRTTNALKNSGSQRIGSGSGASNEGLGIGNRVGAAAVNRRKSIRLPNTTTSGSAATNDILVVGTKTSIHAYDILHNSDLFYKEVRLYIV